MPKKASISAPVGRSRLPLKTASGIPFPMGPGTCLISLAFLAQKKSEIAAQLRACSTYVKAQDLATKLQDTC